MKKEKTVRLENDPLGNILVPAEAYYGSQTQRAALNFKISEMRLPREFIWAQGLIKASAAAVNMRISGLQADIGKAIIEAAEEVSEGKFDDSFIVDVFQAGAGTSQNNNANEIIAKRASELTNNAVHIHPNDHVNMSQSTNDTFPTALNLAAAKIINEQFMPALKTLIEGFQFKSNQFMPILKAGRTHLHDGVPMRLGQEFEGYYHTLEECLNALSICAQDFSTIGLGGLAIGTPMSLHPDYKKQITKELSERSKMTLKQPLSVFSFMQNMNAPVRFMSCLKVLCLHLIKITSDLRLLSSGPRTGLSEITLPSVQPGSTVMPGKVNPAMLEMTHMVCCQVIGNEAGVSLAAAQGQLEINVFMPFIAHTLLHSLKLITNAITVLYEKCISGIDAEEKNCRHWMEESLALVTGLSEKIGYDGASHIGLEADTNKKTIKEVMQEKGLTDKDYMDAVNPENMI